MIEYVQNRPARLPVVLKDASTGLATNSVTYNQVSVTLIKGDGTIVDVVPNASTWAQVTGTAYAAQGYYNYYLTSSTDVTGVFQYCAFVSGSAPYFGLVKIVAGDTTELWNRLGTPISATIALDIQSISGFGGGGGFTTQDRAWLSATYVTASALPTDPASNTWVSFAVSQSFNSSDRSNLGAIKTKTDNLPSDPASQTTTNTNISAVTTNVNNNTNSNFTTIKGTGFVGTYDSLHQIGINSSGAFASGVLSSSLASAMLLLQGAGFTPGQDDLRNISLAIAGVSGGGGGGFGPADRAMLSATYVTSSLLPADPASNSFLSGVVQHARSVIMGSGTYSQVSGASLAQIYSQEFSYLPTIYTYATRIPTSPAAVSDITAARDYLAGVGYVQANNSLVAISNQFTTGAFSAQDHTWLSATYVSMSMVYATESLLRSDTATIISKTSLLPNDVVGQTWIYPYLANILSASAVSGGFSSDDRTNIIYISQTLGRPQGATISADIFGITQTQASQGSQITQIYTKTSALPVDPVSFSYVQLVSQSLANQIIGGTNTSAQQISASLSTITGTLEFSSSLIIQNVKVSSSNSNDSFNTLITTLGTPNYGSIALDIANGTGQATNAAANALLAYNSANAAAGNATNAANAATNAAVLSLQTQNLIGSPISGTVSLDIAGVKTAVDNVSVSVSSTVDLTSTNSRLDSLLKTIGKPVTTVSEDVRQIGKISLDIQKKVS